MSSSVLFLIASRNSFARSIIQVLGNALLTEQLCYTVFSSKPLQNDSDFIFCLIFTTGVSLYLFDPSTTIQLELPVPSIIQLKIFSVDGQLSATLVNDERQTGQYLGYWNRRDESGLLVNSGIYFYRLDSKHFSQSRKIILIH